MVAVVIPSNISFSNLYTLSGFASGSSLVLTNATATTVYVSQSSSQPDDNSIQFPVFAGQSVTVNGSSNPIWVRGSTGPFFVQLATNAIGSSPSSVIPPDLFTSQTENFRRIKVDVGQTGFFRGREFRTFFEFNIPSNNVQVFKFVSPIDFILLEQNLQVDSGSIRFQALTGATEVVTFNSTLPVIGKNRMVSREIPYYSPQINILTHSTTVSFGSAITGGTIVDNVRVVTGNSSAQQQTVSAGAQSERGLPAGTYYLRLHNFGTGASTGVYSIIWEER